MRARAMRARRAAAVMVAGTVWSTTALSAQARAWSIDDRPSLVIGKEGDPNAIFATIAGATRMRDGRIIVAERGGDFSLHVYGSQGNLLGRYARKGKGPGEAVALAWMYRCGNDLVTYDINGYRVSVFDERLTFRREFRFAEQPYRAACNDHGEFVAMGWERDADMKPGRSRATAPYWIADTAGRMRVSLGQLPGSERFGQSPLPLGRESRVAFGRDRAYVALADSFAVMSFDLAGKSQLALRERGTPARSTAADMNSALEEQIAMMGEKYRGMLEADFKKYPRPDLLPSTRDVLVDSEQAVWVQHYPSASNPRATWTVFAPDGRILSTLTLPRSLEVYEIGRDYVLGRYTDPDESIPQVRMYTLRRQPR